MVEVPVADEADLVVRIWSESGVEGGGSGHRQLQDEEAGVESCGIGNILCYKSLGSLMKLRDLFPKTVLMPKERF